MIDEQNRDQEVGVALQAFYSFRRHRSGALAISRLLEGREVGFPRIAVCMCPIPALLVFLLTSFTMAQVACQICHDQFDNGEALSVHLERFEVS